METRVGGKSCTFQWVKGRHHRILHLSTGCSYKKGRQLEELPERWQEKEDKVYGTQTTKVKAREKIAATSSFLFHHKIFVFEKFS